MKLKIFHTGDIHIGLKFSNYGELKNALIEARFEVLENMINRANDLEADLFVIAGDLFNSLKIPKKEIKKTVEILDRFSGEEVLIIPGNHDYDNGITELWENFRKEDSKNIIVLNENKPYSIEKLETVIYPAYCENKHSNKNNIGWINEYDIEEDEKFHIGIAHGAIEGLSADTEGKYYLMTMEELENSPVDIWLIGHTHVRYPLKDIVNNNKVFNAGAPEPDGMNFSEIGSAWFIELDEDGNIGKKIDTGKYRFIDIYDEIKSKDDLEKIKKQSLVDNYKNNIVRLNLSGNLPKEDYEKLRDFYDDIEKEISSLIIEDDELKENIDMKTIEEEFSKGSFPYEFLSRFSEDEETLQIAYEILRRQ